LIRLGGPDKYKEFVETYYAHVFRTAFAVLHQQQDAEDVAQEVFIQIYRALPEYRNQGLKAWITRITVNKAIDTRRKKGRQNEQMLAQVDESIMPGQKSILEERTRASAPSAELEHLRRERKKFIHDELQELPPNYKDVIQAFYLEEKTYEQISRETGIEKKSVESKLYRARLWMKRHWRKEDFE